MNRRTLIGTVSGLILSLSAGSKVFAQEVQEAPDDAELFAATFPAGSARVRKPISFTPHLEDGIVGEVTDVFFSPGDTFDVCLRRDGNLVDGSCKTHTWQSQFVAYHSNPSNGCNPNKYYKTEMRQGGVTARGGRRDFNC